GVAGATGATGAAGAPGPVGPAGADGTGLGELSISLTSLKLVGEKVKVDAPAAGTLTATLTAGGRTIAQGSGTATKAGTISFSVKKTAYGTTKLKQKSLSGTLTVKFTPKASSALHSQSTIKAKLARKR
ncbi:MAG: hypothetical protein AAGC46_09065, partial [Solirubrobacteraceae bacterium]|nr:hypothetical protein [Patulibacter sp.]